MQAGVVAPPPYIEQRLRQRIPVELGAVSQTTPVVAFGDFLQAEVATLGLNPSRQEFLSRQGELLVGSWRRFETLPSLGVPS